MGRATSILVSCAIAMGVSSVAAAADFYVDPAVGDMANDGSAERPWSTIQEVIEAGLVQTREWAELPYQPGAELVPKNPGAPVQPGDTIWLLSGYHGELLIESSYNADTITIAAAEGQRPELARVHVRASSHWVLRGLHVSAEFAPTYETATLVDLESHDWQGPIHDITVENCVVRSVEDASDWTAQDWDEMACNGFQVDGTNMTVQDNRLRNVDFGISVIATESVIRGNLVDGFSGDGLRGLGDYTTFEGNTVKNCYAVNDNHDDGFQSWSVGSDGEVGTGEVVGIVLRGNWIQNYEDPDQPHRGTLQGIGCFDGMFVDWVVENNVVITDHWHGITLSGARNCRIVNNTVLDLNEVDPGPPWIRIGDHKDGRQSEDCVVRNNLATAFSSDEGLGLLEDHNLLIEDPLSLFVDYASWDLHLQAGAAAIDAGSSELAPGADFDLVPRPQGDGVDIGAYEYDEGERPAAGGAGGSGAAPGAGAAGRAGGTAAAGATGGSGAVAGAGGVATAGGGADATPAGAGSPSSAGRTAAQADADGEDDGGCGCRLAEPTSSWPPGLLLAAALLWLRRRRLPG
jgi:MYXO-CTERM domain-containing protein